MPRIEVPHGKTHASRFVEGFKGEFGLTIRLVDASGREVAADATIASSREEVNQSKAVEFEWDSTVASLQESMRRDLGLRVAFVHSDGSSVAGQMKLESLRTRAEAEQMIVSADERDRADVVSIVGQKLISTLQQEFSRHHPYLGLVLFSTAEHEKSMRGQPARPLASDQTIASVREKKSTEDLSINGNMLVQNLERRILEVYGLYAQVCIMSDGGKRAYTGATHDGYTLSQLNRRQADKGRMPFSYA
jgi:hypothetical protein